MGTDDMNPGPGREKPKGIRVIIQGGSPSSVDFWVRDVGLESPHGAGPESFQHKVAQMITRRQSRRQGEVG